MDYFIDYSRTWLEVMAGGKAAYTANDTSSKVSPHDTENQIVFVTSTLFCVTSECSPLSALKTSLDINLSSRGRQAVNTTAVISN